MAPPMWYSEYNSVHDRGQIQCVCLFAFWTQCARQRNCWGSSQRWSGTIWDQQAGFSGLLIFAKPLLFTTVNRPFLCSGSQSTGLRVGFTITLARPQSADSVRTSDIVCVCERYRGYVLLWVCLCVGWWAGLGQNRNCYDLARLVFSFWQWTACHLSYCTITMAKKQKGTHWFLNLDLVRL